MQPSKYIAQKYVAASPNAQISGYSLLGFLQNVRVEEIKPLLTKYGWHDLEPEQWYSYQTYLDFMKEIGEGTASSTQTLFSIGLKVSETVAYPPGIDSLEKALEQFPSIYRLNTRNVSADEGYSVKFVAKQFVNLRKNVPSPDDYSHGIIWGLTNRFKPLQHQFTVRMIENANPLEEPGTVFEIKWSTNVDELR